MNIANWIKQRAYLEPKARTLKDGSLTLNNAEFYERVLGAVSYLRSRGVRSGDRVAVMLYNSSLFLELFFSCAHVGAILVPLNYRLAGAELKFLIEDSGSAFLILDEAFREKAEPIGTDSEFKVFVNQDNRDTLYSPLDTFELSGGVTAEESVGMDTPLLIMYTSGTTGRPKGVTQSHGNLLWIAIMHLREDSIRKIASRTPPFSMWPGSTYPPCRPSIVGDLSSLKSPSIHPLPLNLSKRKELPACSQPPL
jgi:fatty-acyl-CoA synthase